MGGGFSNQESTLGPTTVFFRPLLLCMLSLCSLSNVVVSIFLSIHTLNLNLRLTSESLKRLCAIAGADKVDGTSVEPSVMERSHAGLGLPLQTLGERGYVSIEVV